MAMLAPGNERSNTCIFLSISKYQSTPGASGYFCKRQRCNRNPPFHAFRDITWGSTIADPMLAAPWVDATFLAPAKVHQWRSAKERRPLSTSFSSSSAKGFRDRLRGLHMWRAANCLSPGKARSRKSSDRKWCRSLKHREQRTKGIWMGKEICYHTLQLHQPSSDHHSNHRKHMCSSRSLACRWCLWLLRDSVWNTFEKVPFSVYRTKELGANRRVNKNVLTYTFQKVEYAVYVLVRIRMSVGCLGYHRAQPMEGARTHFCFSHVVNSWTTTPNPWVPWSISDRCCSLVKSSRMPSVRMAKWNPSNIFHFQTTNNSARGVLIRSQL